MGLPGRGVSEFVSHSLARVQRVSGILGTAWSAVADGRSLTPIARSACAHILVWHRPAKQSLGAPQGISTVPRWAASLFLGASLCKFHIPTRREVHEERSRTCPLWPFRCCTRKDENRHESGMLELAMQRRLRIESTANL